jgi:hypothetical protein
MRKVLSIALAITIGLALSVAPTNAQIVKIDEARIVAENWIGMIVALTGDWGAVHSATVGEIEELRRDNRLLGYWCHIEPEGHIVVSLLRGLPPVTAYSATWDGDPECDADIIDIIKYRITAIHEYIEKQIGPLEAVSAGDIDRIAEFSLQDEWDRLTNSPGEFPQRPELNSIFTNYEQNEIMMTTKWDQIYPYNLFCPGHPVCTDPRYNGHCAAGCVAVAAAQIMKYWCWPPYGSGYPYDDPYNWTYMPDSIGPSYPQYQIDAVANLIAEIGLGCLMDYCHDGEDCGSGAYHGDMVDALENYFRYDPDLHMLYKDDYDNVEWFELIKEQLNVNRPLQTQIEYAGEGGHSIVCDGYQHFGDFRYYHMNYGWGGMLPARECWEGFTSSNSWFMVYGLPCTVEKNMIAGVQPDVSLDALLGPIYGNNPSFPYRYANVDASGTDVTFSAGQLIQFLPGIDILCTSTTGSAIRILGSPGLHTRLFTRGDITKGVRIENGGIALYGGGGVRLY